MSGKASTGLTGLEVDNLVRQKIVQRCSLFLRGLETLPEVSGFRESSAQTFTAIKVGILYCFHLHHDSLAPINVSPPHSHAHPRTPTHTHPHPLFILPPFFHSSTQDMCANRSISDAECERLLGRGHLEQVLLLVEDQIKLLPVMRDHKVWEMPKGHKLEVRYWEKDT